MDFVSMVQVLLRRFYVVVPLVAVSILLGLSYGTSVKPTYQYSEPLLLISPVPPATPTLPVVPTVPYKNPWFQLSKNLTPVESLVIDAMAAPGAETGVKPGSGVSVSYGAGSNTAIPLVTITTAGHDPRAAETALAPAIAALNANLSGWQRQAGATTNALVTTLPAPGGFRATVLYPGKTRGEAAIIAVGIVISLVLTFVTEAIVRRRRQWKAPQATIEEVETQEHALALWDSEQPAKAAKNRAEPVPADR